VAQHPNSGLNRLTFDVPRSLTPVGLIWTSDQLVAEAYTYTTREITQETNIQAVREIRTSDPSNTATELLGLKPHDHRNRQRFTMFTCISVIFLCFMDQLL
jgi:hypothetical protein